MASHVKGDLNQYYCRDLEEHWKMNAPLPVQVINGWS